MSTRKFAIPSYFFGTLILSAAIYFSFGLPDPLFAQTSETRESATEHTGKEKPAESSYSYNQVPEDVPSNDQLMKLLREQNARLKAENARLKAEIAKLKANK